MRKIEILGPAGSKEGIYAALNAGADAVYVGTSRFGARAFAKNPSVEELEEALVYAHLRDKKIYLTVNTLLTDQEIQGQLYEMIAPLYEAGLDACIVQDPGVMSFLHRNFPEMDLHASTQMTLFSGEEANLYKNLGVTRYVPARELSIEEIKQARKQTDLEMEVFVHGALCYCYSGQCLMSEVIGGRSGNRGMCAQPCRLAFEGDKGRKNYLNTKDICTLLYIPELVEAGIDSFKIEGRMKRWEYSAYMSHLYRRYVDLYQEQGIEKFDDLRRDRQSILWQDYRNSQDLYNRGGFSKSYLFETDNRAMMDTTRTGHYGVRVASVIRADSHQAQFLVDETIHPQDVLEFRNEKGEKVYEFTSGSSYEKGETAVTRILPGCGVKKGQSLFRTKNNRLLDKYRNEENVSKITLKGTFKAVRGKDFALEEEAPAPPSGCVARSPKAPGV
ncbi:MAG: peptidase U32 family protein [Eubacterium sp.]